MPTMSFRVPDEVKKAFDAAFAKENKSAIMARMMMEAVEEEKLRLKQAKAISQKEVPAARKKPRK